MEQKLEHVDFKTAKILKEIGFDWYTHTGYIDITDNPQHVPHPLDWGYCNYNREKVTIADNHVSYCRPTIQLCAQWLREVKGLHIYIVPAYSSTEELHWHYYIYLLSQKCVDPSGVRHQGNQTHDIALLSGITKVLEIFKNKSE